MAAFAVVGAQAQEQERKGDLKVMTYNIRFATMKDGPNAWIYRKDASVAMINEQKPDVFAMQEVLFKQKKYLDVMLFEDYQGVGVSLSKAPLQAPRVPRQIRSFPKALS